MHKFHRSQNIADEKIKFREKRRLFSFGKCGHVHLVCKQPVAKSDGAELLFGKTLGQNRFHCVSCNVKAAQQKYLRNSP